MLQAEGKIADAVIENKLTDATYEILCHFCGQIFDVVHFVGQIDPQNIVRITALVDLGLFSSIGLRALQFLIGTSKKNAGYAQFFRS